MIEGGKGGATTQTGLKFEKDVAIEQTFAKIKGYTIENEKLLFNGTVVALLYKKHDLYKNFLSKYEIEWEKILSKKLLPDQAVFVLETNTLFIIEVKFQKIAGSVDEKLQTCDFKKKRYEKLFETTEIKIEYCYVLNQWFTDPRYEDTMNYIASVECHFFIGELPLEFLGLPTPV